MNRLRIFVSFALSLLMAGVVLTLSGCSGFSDAVSTETTVQVTPGGFRGSVFGGHAPIVGAHVFLLEAETTTGYGGKASSLLSSTYSGTTYPTAQDTMGTSTTNPTYGLYYVTTDSTGQFNITGDYTCTAGRPVYLYAQGGSPDANPSFSITSAVGNVVSIGGNDHLVVTFTTSTNLLYAGQQVTFSGIPSGTEYSGFDGTTQTVSATGLSTTQFEVELGLDTTPTPLNTYSPAATGTPVASGNPQIVNLAMLGNCPGTSGEFANSIKYVYMNEVSTVATAYAMAGFAATTGGVVTDATHIGSSANNLVGLQNAAVNAGQLYDITGGNTSTTFEGEGHIARATTPAGNGNVPQALLDTLGNILASCVDSLSTYNPYLTVPIGTQSTQCTTLFATATSNGASGGTVPNDIATAAFNIARNPGGPANGGSSSGGTSYTFVQTLFNLPSNAPFSPQLTAQPNDFTMAIQYPLALNPAVSQAESLGIDGNGNVWMNSYGNKNIFKLSPVGVVTFSSAAPLNPAGAPYSYGYLSIDPSNNVWSGGNFNTTYETEFNNSGSVISGGGYAGPFTGGFYDGYITVTDSTGAAYIGGASPATTNQWSLIKMTSSGVNEYYTTSVQTGGTTPLVAAPFGTNYDIAHGAVDNIADGGDVWLTTEASYGIGRYDPTTGRAAFTALTVSGAPEMPAIDSASNMWVAYQSNSVIAKITKAGVVSNPTGGTLVGPFGVAIDGAGNAWVANRANGGGASSLVEYANAGTAVSPATTNYTLGGLISHPLNLAVDPSGVLWITSFDSSLVLEMLGTAVPTTTPLSYASGQNKLGVRP